VWSLQGHTQERKTSSRVLVSRRTMIQEDQGLHLTLDRFKEILDREGEGLPFRDHV
jgi:hypothetical protein